ncbi:DUF3995 domain-containing protein [Luteipulveratus flavus]|uniref:DUF3995 domain-containing protein n=1 Tax=Luteipulveratus flavus TaxID=3031728 RepID=A0ABT6C8G4_9MICO|nr:DUF3995 domain-containing protein [Luteipulveratus sp. YIM 133296]MDF8265207.1 DUF3995 domain-containing protein [Luteipulveratus sp. YIM 133296]
MATVGQDPTARTARSAPPALSAAAVAGVLHGAISLYWASGGDWLIETLGQRLLDAFADSRWVLFPVGVAKIAGAVVPLLLARRGLLNRVLWRVLCWIGALGLIVWGGLNTVVGNLVLADIIRPDGGYDHAGMVGHAWLWDPLFLLWGLCLAVGLRRSSGHQPPSMVRTSG